MLSLIIALVVFGFLLWLINSFIPMDPNVKKILNVFAIIILIIWILQAIGILPFGIHRAF